MNYKEQMTDWMQKHPEATPEQAFEAGYWIFCDNWCKKRR